MTGERGRFQASDGELLVDLNVSSSCGHRTTYETIKGRPNRASKAGRADRERRPRWALGVTCEAKTASFTAEFILARYGAWEEQPGL